MTDLLMTEELVAAHERAITATQDITRCTEEQAEEFVTALVALVFETLKQYLQGEDTCN